MGVKKQPSHPVSISGTDGDDWISDLGLNVEVGSVDILSEARWILVACDSDGQGAGGTHVRNSAVMDGHRQL